MPARRIKIVFGLIVAVSLPTVLAFATLRQRTFRIACQNKDWDKAIEIRPKSAPVWAARGIARKKKGDLDGAIADFTQALALDPALVPAYNDRGNALGDKGDFDSAIADYTRAIQLDPKYGRAWINRGIIRSRKGDLDGAIADCTRAIEIEPQFARAYNSRGGAHKKKGDIAAAIADYEKAIKFDAGYVQACNNLAWVLATSKEEKFRDGRRAIDLARRAGLMTEHEQSSIYNTLAAAYAETGRFDRAIKTQEEALKILPAGDTEKRAEFEARLELYRAGKPYRE